MLGRVGLQPVELEFAAFASRLQPLSAEQVAEVDSLRARLQAVTPGSACEVVSLEGLKMALSLAAERHALVAAAGGAPRYPGSFAQMEDGAGWYRHWLRSWLLSDVEPEALEAIALEELRAVAALRAALPVAGASQLPRYAAHQHDAIVAAFRDREATVTARLPELFGGAFSVPLVDIVPSNLPKSFPAPGIYDPETGQFLYHLQGDALEGSHMDWLFLHEAIPGHHFQHHVAAAQGLCPADGLAPPPLVTAEGWAAYVETIGPQLGLLQDPASLGYALQWRTLRALRVLMDVGIHLRGWSDAQARALWDAHLPGTEDIFERELGRVHRWPVQSITYVYGRSRIEAALAEAQVSLSEAQARTMVLRMSALPPAAFDHVDALISEQGHRP